MKPLQLFTFYSPTHMCNTQTWTLWQIESGELNFHVTMQTCCGSSSGAGWDHTSDTWNRGLGVRDEERKRKRGGGAVCLEALCYKSNTSWARIEPTTFCLLVWLKATKGHCSVRQLRASVRRSSAAGLQLLQKILVIGEETEGGRERLMQRKQWSWIRNET